MPEKQNLLMKNSGAEELNLSLSNWPLKSFTDLQSLACMNHVLTCGVVLIHG